MAISYKNGFRAKVRTLAYLSRGFLGRIGRYYDTVRAHIKFWTNGATIGKYLQVRGKLNVKIHHTSTLSIGDCCKLKSGFAENPVGGYRRIGIWVGRDAHLTIGNRVGISNSTLYCSRSILIEDDAFIGGGCNIYDTDAHSILAERRLAQPDLSVESAPIIIGKRTFIGGHVTITKGVAIGDEAVIGAGSVVTKSVPAGELWAGNPARFVRALSAVGVNDRRQS